MKRVATFSIVLIILMSARIALSQQVTIGTQTWMTQNLNVDKFRNGDPIPEAKTDAEWLAAAQNRQPAWCYYENKESNGKNFGRLYNGYAVMDPRGIAPAGWHIPCKEEWNLLEKALGGSQGKCGQKIKCQLLTETYFVERGGYDEKKWVECDNCSYWTDLQKKNNPCTSCRNERGWYVKTGKYIPVTKEKRIKAMGGWNGTNSSGFSALPSGSRYEDGSFSENAAKDSSHLTGQWWSSSSLHFSNAWSYYVMQGSEFLLETLHSRGDGFSIRCIKGESNFQTPSNERPPCTEVEIGNQTWMTKDLSVDRFQNGDVIPQAKTKAEWESAGRNKQAVWCYYQNIQQNGADYGKLYNWYAVTDSRGLIPVGWHVPDDTEWKQLLLDLSGLNANERFQNCFGFSTLPGGSRSQDGSFYWQANVTSHWWSSSSKDGLARCFSIYYNDSDGLFDRLIAGKYGPEHALRSTDKQSGYSVRCVKGDGKPNQKARLEPEMVFVEGGSFSMGTNNAGAEESPPHQVSLASFYIGKYEVTQRQWNAVMKSSPSKNIDCEDCPVDNVSWNLVQEYIRKLNAQTGKQYRLPSEAEWEFAARGGVKSKHYVFSGSDEIDSVAWYEVNSSGKTHTVGSKQPNELGIFDMSGNVIEWCNDWAALYTASSQSNPKGPDAGIYRLLRGGGWFYDSKSCRSTSRRHSQPENVDARYGFRLAINSGN